MAIDGFFQATNEFLNVFGSNVFVPVILFIICLILKVPLKKAFLSGVYAGIGLTGFTWIINQYIPIIVPVVRNMVRITGIQLSVIDIGWQATMIVAYATNAGMFFLGVGLLFQTLLFVLRWTNVFQLSDLWNNYSYMIWGSMIAVVTGDFFLALGIMLVMNLYSLLFSELLAPRWSKYYHYPNCTIAPLQHVPQTLFAIPMNWLLNFLGADKINWQPEELHKKLGFIGDPVILGLLLGSLIGLFGNADNLRTLTAWGNIFLVAISTAAIMSILPRVAEIFAKAFIPITEAAQRTTLKNRNLQERNNREIYLAINVASGFGDSATLISGILLIPLMVIIAALIPGNNVMPLVDLITLPFLIQPIVAINNGNIFKVLISSVIWFSLGLLVATITAPVFTEVYSQFALSQLESDTFVTSFAILAKPITGVLMFLPVLNWKWVGLGLSLFFYFILYFTFRRHKLAVYNFIEEQAEKEILRTK